MDDCFVCADGLGPTLVELVNVAFLDELPSRQAQLTALHNTQEFDVLIVGGGATCSDCALDAVTRNKLPFAVFVTCSLSVVPNVLTVLSPTCLLYVDNFCHHVLEYHQQTIIWAHGMTNLCKITAKKHSEIG